MDKYIRIKRTDGKRVILSNPKNTLKTIPFDVQIPNLDGDAVAETIRIDVQAYTDPQTGEDVLTPESLELVEKTQARHMGLMSPDEIKELRQRLDMTQEEMSALLQIVFVPSEGTQDDYPKFDGRTLGEAVEKAMLWKIKQ